MWQALPKTRGLVLFTVIYSKSVCVCKLPFVSEWCVGIWWRTSHLLPLFPSLSHLVFLKRIFQPTMSFWSQTSRELCRLAEPSSHRLLRAASLQDGHDSQETGWVNGCRRIGSCLFSTLWRTTDFTTQVSPLGVCAQVCTNLKFNCVLFCSPFTSRTEEEEDQCAAHGKEGTCGENEGLTSLKQTTLHSDCCPVLEYGLVRNRFLFPYTMFVAFSYFGAQKPGSEIQVQGKIVLET